MKEPDIVCSSQNFLLNASFPICPMVTGYKDLVSHKSSKESKK